MRNNVAKIVLLCTPHHFTLLFYIVAIHFVKFIIYHSAAASQLILCSFSFLLFAIRHSPFDIRLSVSASIQSNGLWTHTFGIYRSDIMYLNVLISYCIQSSHSLLLE